MPYKSVRTGKMGREHALMEFCIIYVMRIIPCAYISRLPHLENVIPIGCVFVGVIYATFLPIPEISPSKVSFITGALSVVQFLY